MTDAIYKTDALIAEDIGAYLSAHENKSMLRFITCGSVDDGKSTLIGRLLYDSKMIFEDQLAALETDSRRVGTQGGEIDFALLVDGLSAEREQGITIDVAYRFFATEKRKFIVADTPGHEQYSRNMATGASTASLAVILIDARKGVLTQTRRHSVICAMLGVPHVVLAVNKMDLVDNDQATFDRIVADYRAFADQLGYRSITAIPMSALKGDNILAPSEALSWYDGPALLPYLETVEVDQRARNASARMPVQWVNRPDHTFRGFAGQLAGGEMTPGMEVAILPSGRTSKIARIVTMDGDLDRAVTGQSVTLTLSDEVDVSRGDVICAADARAEISDQFEARVLWMSDEAMIPGRPYLIKAGTQSVNGQVTRLKHLINVNTLEEMAAKTLKLNDVGVVNIALDRQIAFDPYDQNRATGSFIIIDKLTNNTVGAGMIDFGLRRATNIHWQSLDVDRTARAQMKHQKPTVLWFTGLSGSGKSTVANLVEKQLHAMGRHTFTLDGDNVRHGLNRDLGFTDADRVENIRRVADVARLMTDAGLIVLVSFISPFRSERRLARERMADGEFVEVFVDTPLEICEQRDPKGLYAKARAGQIKNFTGYDSPYEPPEAAEVTLKTGTLSPEAAAEQVLKFLMEKGRLES